MVTQRSKAFVFPSVVQPCRCTAGGCFHCRGTIVWNDLDETHSCLLCGRDQHVYRDDRPVEPYADPRQRRPVSGHAGPGERRPAAPRPPGFYDGVPEVVQLEA